MVQRYSCCSCLLFSSAELVLRSSVLAILDHKKVDVLLPKPSTFSYLS